MLPQLSVKRPRVHTHDINSLSSAVALYPAFP